MSRRLARREDDLARRQAEREQRHQAHEVVVVDAALVAAAGDLPQARHREVDLHAGASRCWACSASASISKARSGLRPTRMPGLATRMPARRARSKLVRRRSKSARGFSGSVAHELARSAGARRSPGRCTWSASAATRAVGARARCRRAASSNSSSSIEPTLISTWRKPSAWRAAQGAVDVAQRPARGRRRGTRR